MMTELSERLRAVADLVDDGMVVADIGTDHGYIPIALVQEGRCPRAVAMDINIGPLDRARAHIQAAELSEKISATARSLKALILQPQSELYKVREYLAEQGYEILAEDMVLEEGKFYPIMKVCPGSPYTLTKEEACYGKELLSQRHPVLQSFLHRELDMKRKVLRELDDKSGDHICQRREALQKETACVEGILGQWESGGKQKK